MAGGNGTAVASGAGALTAAARRVTSELKTLDTYLTTTPSGQLDPGYVASQTAYLVQQLSRLQQRRGDARQLGHVTRGDPPQARPGREGAQVRLTRSSGTLRRDERTRRAFDRAPRTRVAGVRDHGSERQRRGPGPRAHPGRGAALGPAGHRDPSGGPGHADVRRELRGPYQPVLHGRRAGQRRRQQRLFRGDAVLGRLRRSRVPVDVRRLVRRPRPTAGEWVQRRGRRLLPHGQAAREGDPVRADRQGLARRARPHVLPHDPRRRGLLFRRGP